MKLKLQRDKVISSTNKGDLVGVYVRVEPKHKAIYRTTVMGQGYGILHPFKGILEVLLGEFSPKKADAIIKLWNSR